MLFTLTASMIFAANAQTQKVIQFINGQIYWIHGATGTTFHADGSIEYDGGIIVEPAGSDILNALAEIAEPTEEENPYPDMQVPCGANKVWMSDGVTGFWVSVYNNICGPVRFVGNRRYCSNASSNLCSAKTAVVSGIMNTYSNDDCGF